MLNLFEGWADTSGSSTVSSQTVGYLYRSDLYGQNRIHSHKPLPDHFTIQNMIPKLNQKFSLFKFEWTNFLVFCFFLSFSVSILSNILTFFVFAWNFLQSFFKTKQNNGFDFWFLLSKTFIETFLFFKWWASKSNNFFIQYP